MDEAYAIILLGDKLKDSNSFIRTKNEMPRSCRSEAFPFLYINPKITLNCEIEECFSDASNVILNISLNSKLLVRRDL